MKKLTFRNKRTRQKVTIRCSAGISNIKATQDFRAQHGKEWALIESTQPWTKQN